MPVCKQAKPQPFHPHVDVIATPVATTGLQNDTQMIASAEVHESIITVKNIKYSRNRGLAMSVGCLAWETLKYKGDPELNDLRAGSHLAKLESEPRDETGASSALVTVVMCYTCLTRQ